jgi:hypothetical protein
MNNLVVVLIDEKKKIIYDSIFDIFKIIFGYEVGLIFALVLKIIFEPDSLTNGILLLILDIIIIIWTIFGFGTILYDIWNKV